MQGAIGTRRCPGALGSAQDETRCSTSGALCAVNGFRSASTKTSWAVTGRARTTALNWQHADAAGPRCDCSSSSFVHGRLTAVALRKVAAWHTGKHVQYDYYLYCCGQQSLLDNYFELSLVSPDVLTMSKSCQPASLQWLSCCSRVRSFSLPMLVLLSPSLEGGRSSSLAHTHLLVQS